MRYEVGLIVEIFVEFVGVFYVLVAFEDLLDLMAFVYGGAVCRWL